MTRKSKATDVQRAAMVLLYDPVTGAIVHGHYVTAPATEMPGRQVLERQAVEYAKRHGAAAKGRAVERLPRLHVDPRGFNPRRAYRVDVRRRTLVAVTARTSRPKGGGQ